MIIDTLRPNGTTTSNFALTGGATLHAVTSDNSDATYGLAGPANGFAWQQFPNHTPAADHERHLVRWRVRSRQDDAGGAGFTLVTTSLEGPTGGVVSFGSFSDTESPVTHAGVWVSNEAADLDFGGAISFDLKHTYNASQNTDEWRVLETYIDIDTREKPSFTADILDGAGVSRDGGTVTDTPAPTLVFGSIDYDGLPGRFWTVEVRVAGGAVVFSASGPGNAPTSIETDPLPNGDYEADLQVFSTIRVNDSFTSDVESVAWTQNFVAPASPVLTSDPIANPPSVDLDWISDSPTATTWDTDDDVVTEIERTDCNGTLSIYMEQTGLGPSSWLDRFMSITEPEYFCIDQFGAIGGTVLRVAGTGYASTPDDPAFAITGDIDMRVRAAPINWTPGGGAVYTLASQFASGGQQAWAFHLRDDAALTFSYSPDGTAGATVTVVSTVNLSGTEGTKWVRVTHRPNDGGGSRETKFFISDDGVNWTQVGATVVSGTAGIIFNSNAQIRIGNRQNGGFFFIGDIYAFQLYDGIDGTLVADPDFTESPWAVGVSSAVDSFGNVWTLNGDGVIESACEVCYRARYWGLVDDVLVASDWSAETCEVLTNPTPGNAWLRGASEGDLSSCPDEDYGRFRPFGVFQPIDGGMPTVITGTPSGRNYNLNFALTSEADLVTLEAILAQPLFFYQPVGQADLWLAPNVSSIQVVKVGRARRLSVDTVAVNPQPVADPASFV
jgi:hypothetical protein